MVTNVLNRILFFLLLLFFVSLKIHVSILLPYPFLACVEMELQIATLVTTLATVITSVGLLSCVNAKMSFQI